MIDVENQVFTEVATVLRSEYTGIKLESDTSKAPSSFPCVYISEADNYAVRNTADSGSIENHVQVMYEVNVYTNENSGKKQKAKEIFNTLDGVMVSLGFRRTTKLISSLDNATKVRIIGRYEAVIDSDEIIYRS